MEKQELNGSRDITPREELRTFDCWYFKDVILGIIFAWSKRLETRHDEEHLKVSSSSFPLESWTLPWIRSNYLKLSWFLQDFLALYFVYSISRRLGSDRVCKCMFEHGSWKSSPKNPKIKIPPKSPKIKPQKLQKQNPSKSSPKQITQKTKIGSIFQVFWTFWQVGLTPLPPCFPCNFRRSTTTTRAVNPLVPVPEAEFWVQRISFGISIILKDFMNSLVELWWDFLNGFIFWWTFVGWIFLNVGSFWCFFVEGRFVSVKVCWWEHPEW